MDKLRLMFKFCFTHIKIATILAIIWAMAIIALETWVSEEQLNALFACGWLVLLIYASFHTAMAYFVNVKHGTDQSVSIADKMLLGVLFGVTHALFFCFSLPPWKISTTF